MEENKTAVSRGSRLRAIEIFYQPVFDVHLNMAIDFEISMQINDRQLGVLLPEKFVPIAEKSNQICEINKWAVEECCDAIIRCAKREADINRVIVPISVKYLSKKNFLQQVSKILEKKQIAPDKFCFNINESILENTKDQVIGNINAAREYGFLVSIDDFGVEFTSLTHLSHYRVDYIGIHASLLDDILANERAQNVVQGIVDFAKKIETKVKVDGVDNEEKAALLRAMGVDQMKGPYYGKPIAERQIKIN
jgi:EAL domain-containing protein (putative c-di-GMP-specific phosphodiesterase class I)